MPYLSFIFKKSLFLQSHRHQVSEGSTRLMVLWFITWSPATLQATCIMAAKDTYLSTLLSATCKAYLGRGGKICRPKRPGHQELGERQWAVQKHRDSLRTCLAVVIPAGQGYVSHMSRYRYMSASSVNRIAHSHCCV